MEYLNPSSLAGAGELSTIESPFLRSYERGNRELKMLPFLQAAEQAQQLDLQKKQQDTSEYTSSPFVGARYAKQAENTATSNANAFQAMPLAQFAAAKADSERGVLPFKQQFDIEDYKQKLMAAQGGPAKALMDQIAAANSYIEKTGKNPMEKQALAQHVIQQWQARNPGARLPSEMTSYDPQKWGLISEMALQTPQHRSAVDKNNASIEGRLEAVRTGNEYRTEMERMKKEYDLEIARLKAEAAGKGGRPPSTNQQFATLSTELTNPETSEDRREIIRQTLRSSPEAARMYKDWFNTLSPREAINTPQNKLYERFLEQKGWKSKSVTSNDVFIQEAMKLGIDAVLAAKLIQAGAKFTNGKFELTPEAQQLLPARK